MTNERIALLGQLKHLSDLLETEKQYHIRKESLKKSKKSIEIAKRILPPIQPNREDFCGLEDLYEMICQDYQAALLIHADCQQLLLQEEALISEELYVREALDEMSNVLAASSAFFPEKYRDRISDIISLIEDHRADSVKEAINVMIQDDYSAKLVKIELDRSWRMLEEAEEMRQLAEEKNELVKEIAKENRATAQKHAAEQAEWQDKMMESQKTIETIEQYCRRCRHKDNCSHFGESFGYCFSRPN